MSEIIHYYQLNVLPIVKEKCGGFATRGTNGKVVLMLVAEEMVVHIVREENQNHNRSTTRHYFVSSFATFPATKILKNEIMGVKQCQKRRLRYYLGHKKAKVESRK